MQLRTIEERDLLMILEWRNHPQIRKNMYNTALISKEEHLNWYKQVILDNTKQYFIYEEKNISYGVIAFTQINKSFNNASWAFYSSPEAPRGVGARMEFLALEYAFYELKLYKLYCEVIDFNELVIKLHKKFGFQIEGLFKEQVYINSDFHDVYRLGLFSEQWDNLRNELSQKLFKKGRNL